ncbi:hypothetical protein SAMN04488012_10912 [Palleronia salina]|uniref:Uncharacterized protein n=1 Tax=Palleronia salina TaxID=313368 RepID=A0A1M6J4G8_9RHOB|nr:hypothetical protein [Palleronia salina]SHJ41573.1 hypothetical protein SAMN04488012_10912 [Palleronia salina]
MTKGFTGKAAADFLNFLAVLSIIGFGTVNTAPSVVILMLVAIASGTLALLAWAFRSRHRDDAGVTPHELEQATFYLRVGAAIAVVSGLSYVAALLIGLDSRANAFTVGIWPIYGVLMALLVGWQGKVLYSGSSDEEGRGATTFGPLALTFLLAIATLVAALLPPLSLFWSTPDAEGTILAGGILALIGLGVWALLEGFGIAEDNDRSKIAVMKRGTVLLGIGLIFAHILWTLLAEDAPPNTFFFIGFSVVLIATLFGCWLGYHDWKNKRSGYKSSSIRMARAGTDLPAFEDAE